MRTYVITGATGNTGKPLTELLLQAGHRVRIITRDAAKAAELTSKGAEVHTGSLTDAAFMTQVLTGADAAYLMIPPNWAAEDFTAYQVAHVDAFAKAITQSGLRYAVTLSSVGAHLTSGAGVVQGLEKMEKALDGIQGLHVRHLRASYFMENILGQIGAIQHMGAMASPVPADMAIPMVATRDIAQAAFNNLSQLAFEGSSVEYVYGPEAVTYAQVAKVMGSAIGKPELPYYTVSMDDFTKAMQGMGAGASLIAKMSEFVQTMIDGKVIDNSTRTPQNSHPTSIEAFAHTFKYVYSLQTAQTS